MGPHELAERVVLERQRGVAARLEELEHGPAPVVRCSPWRASHSPAIVDHTSLMPKLSATVAPHVRSICSRTAPSPAPGSPAVTMWRRPSAAGSMPASRARPGEVGGEGERAVDRGEPEARDEVEQPLGLADADRHDRRARGLQGHVVGDPAGVERVVQAVRDDVAWRTPAIAKAAPPIAELAS